MYILGIDPGNSGAVSLLKDRKLIKIIDTPNATITVNKKQKKRIIPEILAGEIKDMIRGIEIEKCIIEQVNAMPKQGVSSSFIFGFSYGVAIGVLAGLNIPTVKITPARWKKMMGINTRDKNVARMKAAELFPDFALSFSRNIDNDRAESALIGYCGFSL